MRCNRLPAGPVNLSHGDTGRDAMRPMRVQREKEKVCIPAGANAKRKEALQQVNASLLMNS